MMLIFYILFSVNSIPIISLKKRIYTALACANISTALLNNSMTMPVYLPIPVLVYR